MTSAAFFDLDKTVIAKSSALAFGKPLHKAGFLSRRLLAKAALMQLFYVLFGADQEQMDRSRDRMVALTKGWRKADIEQLVTETLDEIAAPLVFAEALFLIDEHRRQGRRVFIVSAGPEEIVGPVARFVGIEDVIATRARIDEEGRFVGKLERYVQGPGKVAAIHEAAEAEGIDLAASYAYSDSATDIPFLEAVGHPVAVNPERELRQHAEEHGWPVLEFERPVALRERFPVAKPVLSGALLTAGVAAAAIVLSRRRTPA